jgi:cellobiose-specific phosphotransferase system component IIB
MIRSMATSFMQSKVTKRTTQTTVECEIWVENSEGKKNTTGAATVLLTSKAK